MIPYAAAKNQLMAVRRVSSALTDLIAGKGFAAALIK
jgi:hypothetical protein